MAIKIINPYTPITKNNLPLVIGYFGCIHVMHQQLLTYFHRFNVLTFTDLIQKKDHQIYNYNLRIENIEKFGPENIYVLDISNHNMTGKEFIEKVLKKLQPASIVVGSDFQFGSDHLTIRELRKDFNVIKFTYNPQISTSNIYKLLQEGQVESANDFLSFPIYFKGRWVSGKKMGRKIGYQTINIANEKPFILKQGSYITKTYIGKRCYKSVTFVGDSKTYSKGDQFIESHIIGKTIVPKMFFLPFPFITNNIKVEFLKYIRENKRFEKLEDLRDAIASDIKEAKNYFKENI